jgi:phytoene synthase
VKPDREAGREPVRRTIGGVSMGPRRVSDVSPRALAASDACCATIVRTKARNFYYGMRLTPPDRRVHLYACYAWMRHADDCIDQAQGEPARVAALESLAARTRDALSGTPNRPDDSDFWPAFRSALRSCDIEPRCILEMVEGMREDVHHRGYDAADDLLRYCYRVGGTVGEVCLAIWGVRDAARRAEAMQLAATRGIAFQLTNILRDIGVDARGGEEEASPRCYVPRDLLKRHGVDAAGLLAWRPEPACRGVVADLVAMARERYEASAGLDRLVDPACAGSLWAMTTIYRRVLDRIAAEPTLCVRGRARVATPAKVVVMARAWAGLWSPR